MQCPRCGSVFVYKMGTRMTVSKGRIHVYQCQVCGHKFGDK